MPPTNPWPKPPPGHGQGRKHHAEDATLAGDGTGRPGPGRRRSRPLRRAHGPGRRERGREDRIPRTRSIPLGHGQATLGTHAQHKLPCQRQLRNGAVRVSRTAGHPCRRPLDARKLASRRRRRQEPGRQPGVSPGPGPRAPVRSLRSRRRIVTGPSLTSLTCIMAPKRPVATSAPAACSWLTSRSTSARQPPGRRLDERRPAAPGRVGVQRELADDQYGQAQFGRGDGSYCRPRPGKGGSARSSAASRSAASWSSWQPTPTSAHRPGPIWPTTSPSTLTDASETRCRSPRTAPSIIGARLLNCRPWPSSRQEYGGAGPLLAPRPGPERRTAGPRRAERAGLCGQPSARATAKRSPVLLRAGRDRLPGVDLRLAAKPGAAARRPGLRSRTGAHPFLRAAAPHLPRALPGPLARPPHWLAYISSDFYDNAIFAMTLGLAAWTWWRRPDIYRPLRNDLVLANLIGFAVFWLFPVAPPRMLPGFTMSWKKWAAWAPGTTRSSPTPTSWRPCLPCTWPGPFGARWWSGTGPGRAPVALGRRLPWRRLPV